MFPHMVQRSPFRSFIAITLSFSLLLLPVFFGPASEAAPGQGVRAGKPRREKPEGELPDLEEVQRESLFEREAPAPIPSTVRSAKVPLEPWNGRRVGDSEPRPRLEQTESSSPADGRVRRAHARRRLNPPPPVLDDQFVQNFFTWTVLRAPNATEATYWKDQLRVAYAQGQSSVKLVAVLPEQGRIQHFGAGLVLFEAPTLELDNEPGGVPYRVRWRTGSAYLLQDSSTSEPKDCYEFADEVDRIQKEVFVDNRNPATNSYPHNISAFMDTLARRFTELSAATDVALYTLSRGQPQLLTEFGSANFAHRFVDTSWESANQARHAIFGLVMGFSGGGALVRNLRGDFRSTLELANARENPNSSSGRADIALNNVTVPMGESLHGPGAELRARSLAAWIRNDLCAPK